MHGDQRAGMPGVYQIRVEGALDEGWSDWFNGMEVTLDLARDGTRVTTLTGAIDQSALHGILARIRDLNLRLMSVTQMGLGENQPQERRFQM